MTTWHYPGSLLQLVERQWTPQILTLIFEYNEAAGGFSNTFVIPAGAEHAEIPTGASAELFKLTNHHQRGPSTQLPSLADRMLTPDYPGTLGHTIGCCNIFV